MYFLVLAALLQLDSLAPKVYSKHSTLADCVADADEENKRHAEEFLEAANKPLGLRFVCLEMRGSV